MTVPIELSTNRVATPEFTDGSQHQFASARSGVAVIPDDNTVLDFNALWVGGTGDVSVDHEEGGTAVVYKGVPAGVMLPVSGVRVNGAPATTATDIVAIKW